jgi:hypothetical protein
MAQSCELIVSAKLSPDCPSFLSPVEKEMWTNFEPLRRIFLEQHINNRTLHSDTPPTSLTPVEQQIWKENRSEVRTILLKRSRETEESSYGPNCKKQRIRGRQLTRIEHQLQSQFQQTRRGSDKLVRLADVVGKLCHKVREFSGHNECTTLLTDLGPVPINHPFHDFVKKNFALVTDGRVRTGKVRDMWKAYTTTSEGMRFATLYNKNSFAKTFATFFPRQGKGVVYYKGLSVKETVKTEPTVEKVEQLQLVPHTPSPKQDSELTGHRI